MEVKQMIWILWLDDVRNPLDQIGVEGLTNVRWARDVEQAQYYTKVFGPPSFMYLDHDISLPAYIVGKGDHETAMDYLKWLQNEHPDCIQDMQWYFLTANPVGKENMESYLNSWKKSIQYT